MDLNNEKFINIRVSKRELGLLNYITRGLFARIDSDVTSWGSSCTGHDTIEHDYFGKDAILGLYKELKFTVDNFTEGEHTLRLPRKYDRNYNPVPRQ